MSWHKFLADEIMIKMAGKVKESFVYLKMDTVLNCLSSSKRSHGDGWKTTIFYNEIHLHSWLLFPLEMLVFRGVSI